MRRAIFNLVRAAATLLCVAAIIFWIRSYRISEGFASQQSDGSEREFVSYAGGLHIRQTHPQSALAPLAPTQRKIKEPVPANATWQTRAGVFTNHVVWQRAGFVLLAANTQTITITGAFGGSRSSGTLDATYFSKGILPASFPISTIGGASAMFQSNSTQLLMVIPWWFIVALTGLLPAAAVLRAPIAIRNFRRRKRGLCTHCGYDLRSSTDRCPECGHHRDQE